MHPTLRVELRSTQKVVNFVRACSVSPSTSRARSFSQRPFLNNDNKPGPKIPTQTFDQSGDPRPSVSSFKPSELGSEIEDWINHLSNNNRPLTVWDTISERDESGKWKLLPQARKDLEDVDSWAKRHSSVPRSPFGIKVANGRIHALSTKELHQEQAKHTSQGLVHGPFVSATGSGDVSAEGHAQEQAKPSTILPTDNSMVSITEGNDNDVYKYITELTAPPNAESPNFYGSAAARRQRVQRPKEKTTTYKLPSWFYDQNVIRYDSGQLAAKTRFQVTTSRADRSGSRRGIVLWHSDAFSTADQLTEKHTRNEESGKPTEEKQQILASGGDNTPSGSDPGHSDAAVETSGTSPIFVPLTDPNGSYLIEEAQHNELMTSAKGRLKLPTSGSLDTRSSGIRGHLIIHYAAPDAEILLDRLVEDMARRLQCNLVALDAQDISNLIVKADVDSYIKNEAAVLGYDIYNEVYRDDSTDQDSTPPNLGEDADDAEDDFGAPSSKGMPFMVGKPITIDLKALFSSKPHRRPSGLRPSNAVPDIFSTANTPKTNAPLFAGIVDSILSSSKARSKDEDTEVEEDNEQQQSRPSNGATIVHVKDLRLIQDTHVGKQFLSQLYEQVERRRTNGESIMLVGTECSREPRGSYDHARITSMQSSSQEEISSTLVITPVEAQGQTDLSVDRAKRLQTINARHLWQMLQSKSITLDTLQPNFWRDSSADGMHAADRSYLEKSLWSFGYVQRLAAILASSEFSSSQHPIAEAAAIIDLSDSSKYSWARQGQKDGAGDSKKHGFDRSDKIAKVREKANKHEKRLLGGVIEPTKIATTFNDIHIPEDTVEALQTLTTLSLVRPDAFKYGVLASDRIPGLLLYGPPGTGKTLAAKAVARESGATMLEVSSADINDKYVGEGEKNVKALFSLAKKLSPCVVFLDEADAMFSARGAQGRRVSHRELLNQFLKEWDGMSNDSGSAFIMIATNRPMDLDDAVLRRLPRRVLIDLPTESDRLEILKIHLRHEQLAEDVNLSQIATKTPFYSGSDLKNLAVSAALNAVRGENAAAKAKAGEDLPEYPAKRTLTAHDFEKALEEISASISEDMSSLKEIKKFDEQFGDRKGRKRKSPKWGFQTAAQADAVLDTIKVRS